VKHALVVEHSCEENDKFEEQIGGGAAAPAGAPR